MEHRDDGRARAPQRASDPSLTEMLRRARDAPLGGSGEALGTSAPRFVPLTAPADRALRGGRRRDGVVLLLGILLGVLTTHLVDRAVALAGGTVAPAPIVAPTVPALPTLAPPAPTDTPEPAPTDTPTPTAVPTATAAPTAPPPPSTGDIVALAKAYYDQQGPFAGRYVLLDATAVQIESQDGGQLAVCMGYEVAAVDSPDTVADTGTRTFTLVAAPDGTWQVVQMGDADSCSLS